MEITQIQLSYIEPQDRVFARINLGTDKHLSLILTRRICKFILENLAAYLKVDLPESNISQTNSSQSRQESMDAQTAPISPPSAGDEQSELPPGVQRDQPFEERDPEGSLLEKGYEPALVENAGCNRTEDSLTFTFFLADSAPLNLNLSPALASGLNQLVRDIVVRTHWFDGFTSSSTQTREQAVMPSEEEKKTITYH